MSPTRAGAQQGQPTLDFYFDFVSPYGYFAVAQIEALALRHGRTLRWHPFHMRSVMKDLLGVNQALTEVPLKGSYVRNDVRRMARYLGLPYNPAPAAGFSSVAASRVFYLLAEQDPVVAASYARAVFHSQHALAESPNRWEQCTALALQAAPRRHKPPRAPTPTEQRPSPTPGGVDTPPPVSQPLEGGHSSNDSSSSSASSSSSSWPPLPPHPAV